MPCCFKQSVRLGEANRDAFLKRAVKILEGTRSAGALHISCVGGEFLAGQTNGLRLILDFQYQRAGLDTQALDSPENGRAISVAHCLADEILSFQSAQPGFGQA